MRQVSAGRIAKTSSGNSTPKALAVREVLATNGGATKGRVLVGGVAGVRRRRSGLRRGRPIEISVGGLACHLPPISDGIGGLAKVAVGDVVMLHCTPGRSVYRLDGVSGREVTRLIFPT